MGVSKILFDGYGIDLSSDTVIASALNTGSKAYNSSGDVITGTGGYIRCPSGTLTVTSTGYKTEARDYYYAKIDTSTLIASNIKSGVTILGVTGTYSAGYTIYINNESEVGITIYIPNHGSTWVDCYDSTYIYSVALTDLLQLSEISDEMGGPCHMGWSYTSSNNTITISFTDG